MHEQLLEHVRRWDKRATAWRRSSDATNAFATACWTLTATTGLIGVSASTFTAATTTIITTPFSALIKMANIKRLLFQLHEQLFFFWSPFNNFLHSLFAICVRSTCLHVDNKNFCFTCEVATHFYKQLLLIRRSVSQYLRLLLISS